MILNTAAGRGRAARVAEPVLQHLRDRGADVAVERPADLDDARRLAAARARDGRVVVAAGGDGLAGAVAGAVAGAGGVLGLVPAGRGNDFARQVGLAGLAADRLADVLLAGRERAVDLLDCDGTLVAGSVFAGIDSAANVVAARRPRVPDAVVYEYAALRCLARWRAPRYEVTVDGEPRAYHGYTAVAANSGFYGAGLRVAPDAALDDGLIDVVTVADSPRVTFPRLLAQMRAGRHVDRDDVAVVRGREVTIDADRPLVAYGDGEPIGGLPVTVRVRPGVLRMLCP